MKFGKDKLSKLSEVSKEAFSQLRGHSEESAVYDYLWLLRKEMNRDDPIDDLTPLYYQSPKTKEENVLHPSDCYSEIVQDFNELIRKDFTREQAQKLISRQNAYIEDCKREHLRCHPVLDWDQILMLQPPFLPGEKGPKQLEIEEKLNHFKPNLLEKAMRSDGNKRKARLEESMARGRQQDESAYEVWQSLYQLALNVADFNRDECKKVLEKSGLLKDFLRYASRLEIQLNDHKDAEVTFEARDLIPTQLMNLTKSGRFSAKEMTKSMHYDLLQDNLCSVAIHMALELFALLPLKAVTVNIEQPMNNLSTGHFEMHNVLSVRFYPHSFDGILLYKIDPSSFISICEHNMKFLKTSGFKPVPKLHPLS